MPTALFSSPGSQGLLCSSQHRARSPGHPGDTAPSQPQVSSPSPWVPRSHSHGDGAERYLAAVLPAGVGAHHLVGDGVVVAGALIAEVAADHRPLHLLELVGPAAAVADGAPARHHAHRIGRHVPVLPLERQHLHVRVQLRFLLQLPRSKRGPGSVGQDQPSLGRAQGFALARSPRGCRRGPAAQGIWWEQQGRSQGTRKEGLGSRVVPSWPRAFPPTLVGDPQGPRDRGVCRSRAVPGAWQGGGSWQP